MADLTTFPIPVTDLISVPRRDFPHPSVLTWDVSKLATGGAGVWDDPWTGWDTALVSLYGPNRSFRAPSGVYALSSTWQIPAYLNQGFFGDLGTVLKYTGSSRCVEMIEATGVGISLSSFGSVFENFIIDGGGTATDGFYGQGLYHSRIWNVYVRNVTEKKFYFRFAVLNDFKLHATSRVGNVAGLDVETTNAVNGCVFDHDGTIANAVQCNRMYLIVEFVTGTGIILAGAHQNKIFGSSEQNGGKNLVCYGNGNTFQMDNEFSSDATGEDFTILGSYNKLDNCLSTGRLRIGNDVDGGDYIGNVIDGGQFGDILIDTNAKYTRVMQPAFNFLGAGQYKNDSALTQLFGSPIDYAAKVPTAKTGSAASDTFTGATFGDQWFTDSFVVDPPSASITLAIASNAFAITLPNSTGGTLFSGKANGGHAMLDTGFERVKHVSRPAAGSYQVRFSIGKSARNCLQFMLSAGTLTYQTVSGGSAGAIASIAYNSVSMLYWRFLRSGANVKAQYSADAASWTDLGTSTGAPFDFTNFRTCLEAGSTGSSTYSAAVVFDDYVIG